MFFDLQDDYRPQMCIGNKARFLMEMTGAGFRVPKGFALDREEYDRFLDANGLRDAIKSELDALQKDDVAAASARIRDRILAAKLPEQTVKAIATLIDPANKYAVRSSGAKEDLAEFSFAGQYESVLNCAGADEIAAAVVRCYASAFSVTVLSYLCNHTMDLDGIYMGVVVQEMVDSDYSGVCFTINPVTGVDKEMLIEVVKGLGENLVSGRVEPEEYFYHWYENSVRHGQKATFLTDSQCRDYGRVFLRIQKHFGYPCDIEFAIQDGELYILQSRKITKIRYAAYPDVWTTADFKDGGVSASVCTPYMWSLYEYIWDYTLRKFTLESKIIFEKDLEGRLLGDMFFGRPYWNLSFVKLAMSRVIGYKEREFDSEYGIKIHYEGDGQTTGLTPRTLFAIIRMALAQRRILKEREDNAENLKNGLLETYRQFRDRYDRHEIADIKRAWYELTKKHYLHSESTYFWQIFINTVHQSLYKDSLLKFVSESDYLTMLSCIEDISHLLPFYEIWDISRAIRADAESRAYWESTDAKAICADLQSDAHQMPLVRHLIEQYGYHSDKELDVTYPCYYEDPEPYIVHIQNTVALDDSFSPANDREKGRKSYEAIFDKMQSGMRAGKYKKVRAKVDKMRKMLWWREEFRDVSTRFYYLIRIYTVEFAKTLEKEGVLANWEDVWFLKVGMLWDYLDGKMTKESLAKIIAKNRDYYDSFRNYLSENEIGSVFDGSDDSDKTAVKGRKLKGLGANNGTVTGTARVITDFSEIERIRPGEILVTRFTDTGWTPKFAIIKGIVTEYGGILCHAAIVSREYGIPAVVACHDALASVRDGQQITVNGTTGEVFLGE